MKVEEFSMCHVVLRLMHRYEHYRPSIFWELIRVALELLDDDVFLDAANVVAGAVLGDPSTVESFQEKMRGLSKKNRIRKIHSDTDESVSLENEILRGVEDFLSTNKPSEYNISRRKVQVINILDEDNLPCPIFGTKSYGKVKAEIVEKIQRSIEKLINGTPDVIEQRIDRIGRFFELEEFEKRFLLIVFHETYFSESRLSDLIRLEPDLSKDFAGTNELYEGYDLIDFDEFHPLIQKGLIAKSNYRQSIILTKTCLQWIMADRDPDLMSMFLEIEDCSRAFELASYQLAPQTSELCMKILKNKLSTNILLHGKEGTGKTEFAKSLVKEIGGKCFFLRPFDKKGKDSISERRMALYVASRIVASIQDAVLVVDEADDLLATMNPIGYFDFLSPSKDDDKAWCNQFMDKSSAKIIWIANDLRLHASTVRRFTFLYKFPDLSPEKLSTMVQRVAGANEANFLPKTETSSLVDQFFGLNVGSFGTAIKTAAAVEGSEAEKKDIMVKILESHFLEIGDAKPRRNLAKDFNADLINADTSIEKIYGSIEALLCKRSHLPQLSMLLYGMPGTGKTELVHQIARNFNLKLHALGSSDLISKYVGESERNIAAAFRKVGADGKSILFIDEADSLFTSRSSAERSWEISRTNELLRQMENFRGIFIAATNFEVLLDEACLRRFHLKVKMLPLTPAQVLQLYITKFTDLAGELDPANSVRVQSLRNVTFGDLHAAWAKFSYESSLTHAEIISSIESEIKWKRAKKEIGLGATVNLN